MPPVPSIRDYLRNDYLDPRAIHPDAEFHSIERMLESLNETNTARMTIRYAGQFYRLQVQMRSDIPSSEGPRYEHRITESQAYQLVGNMQDPGVTAALRAGREMALRYNMQRESWFILGPAPAPQPASSSALDTEPLPPVTRNRVVLDIDEYAALPEAARQQIEYANEDRRTAEVRFRNNQATLRRAQDEIIRLERVVEQQDSRLDNLARAARTVDEQARTIRTLTEATRHNESLLAETDTLRRTAAIWRDATNGTPAKLKAFKNFCAALDSLPAAPDEQ